MANAQNNIPNPLDRMVQRARAESGLTQLSHSFQYDEANRDRVATAIRDSTPRLIRTATIHNHSHVVQFLCVQGVYIDVFSIPMIALDDNQKTIYLGNLSDELGTITPVSMSREDFLGTVTSLMPRAEAEAAGFAISDQAPDTIMGIDSDDPGIVVAPSMERLNFGPDAADIDPVIITAPKCIAVPTGVALPVGTQWALVDELPPEIKALYPVAEAWRKTMLYAVVNNQAKSVTEGGTLFDLDDVNVDNISGSVAVEIEPALTMLDPRSSHYAEVKTAAKAAEYAAFTRAWALLPDQHQVFTGAPTSSTTAGGVQGVTGAPAAGGVPAPSMMLGMGPAQLQELIVATIAAAAQGNVQAAQAASTVKSKSESEHEVSAEECALRLSIAFASIKTVHDPEEGGPSTLAIIPATINPEVAAILALPKINMTVNQLKVLVTNARREKETSDHRLDSKLSFDQDLVDAMLVSAIKHYQFLFESVNADPHQVTTKVTLANFAEPHKTSVLYTERLVKNRLIQTQELVGEEKTKVGKKNTVMYTGGRLSTVDDIAHLIRNFRFFFGIFITNFDESEAWKAIAQFETVLHSKGGSRLAQLAESQAQVGLNLFIEVQMIFSNFMAIGNDMKLVKAAKEGAPIDPDNYREACEFATAAALDLGRAARAHKITGYDHIPPAEALFPQLGLQADRLTPSGGGGATAAAGGNRNGAGGGASLRAAPKRASPNGHTNAPRKNNRAAVVSPANGKGESSGPDATAAAATKAAAKQAQIDNAKKRGFLTWDCDKKLPNCTVRVKTATSNERICIHFIARGGHCSFGSTCRSAHPTKLTDLPAEAQVALAAWVEKTTGMDFVPDPNTPGTAERPAD